MNSRNVVNVTFELKDIDEVDYLEVVFEDEQHALLRINLNDETQCQEDLKKVFLLMSQLMVTSDLGIEFVESDGYPREFIYSAMKAYVADLKNEVATVAELMKGELNAG